MLSGMFVGIMFLLLRLCYTDTKIVEVPVKGEKLFTFHEWLNGINKPIGTYNETTEIHKSKFRENLNRKNLLVIAFINIISSPQLYFFSFF